jgi:predicted DNA-binding transcriptional regulator AlpA
MSSKKQAPSAPKRHHLDRRADKIAAAVVAVDDELIDTRQLADFLGVSVQWCEIARHRGVGPEFKRLGARCIRYKKSDVLKWLDARATYRTTGEYTGRKAEEAA